MNYNPNISESLSQKENILAYLKRGKVITPLEALNLFGCMRLQARIYDIKEDGYNICKAWKELPNGKRVMSYWLSLQDVVLSEK